MKVQILDNNGDWTMNFQSNNNNVISQEIATRLKEWQNDCFFNTSAGIDWLNRLSGKNQQDGLVNDIRQIILQTDGVSNIVNLDINFDSLNRKMSIFGTVKTIYLTQANFNINILS